MRKHSVRKWLHAILDLLPLFVIPIFAIYSRNENAQFGYEVTTITNKEVNFNQKGNWATSIAYDSDLSLIISTSDTNYYPRMVQGTFEDNHYYAVRPYIEEGSFGINMYYSNNVLIHSFTNLETYIFKYDVSIANDIFFLLRSDTNDKLYMNVFDLTQIYNSEIPTISEFNENFPNDKYPYTLGETRYIEGQEVTYNDTDIGSQMIYTLYNTVDKYFNMNKVFNMGAIWNWVNNTMFGGGAPLSAYIVYQIIAYELIMDIILLLYSVMMFIVDFAEKGIDRFMGRSC